ncbi:hypothetical protein Sjap_024260 [Stephania japonica]|uniref:Probable histone-arginine methyltransferase CARM1-like N-terminal PH domain-containing protein n=1 Tax=Stephania japonica TaxID=461633 RepID=A0AAP0EIE1_9MAGN
MSHASLSLFLANCSLNHIDLLSSSSLSQIPNLAIRFSSSSSLQNLNFSRANPRFEDSSIEGLLGQKLNWHEFSLVSVSMLPFLKESGEAAVAARFVFESGTAQLKFHHEAELSNVVVCVDLRSAQRMQMFVDSHIELEKLKGAAKYSSHSTPHTCLN